MVERAQELEAGELPTLAFPDDGSFFEQFRLLEEEAKPNKAYPATRIHVIDVIRGDEPTAPSNAAEPDTTCSNITVPVPAPAPTNSKSKEEAPNDPPKPGQQKKPIILNSKRPIAKFRQRPEGPAPSSKKIKDSKGNDATKNGASAEKSFYLQELERYRQKICDASTGDRPLVK